MPFVVFLYDEGHDLDCEISNVALLIEMRSHLKDEEKTFYKHFKIDGNYVLVVLVIIFLDYYALNALQRLMNDW